MDHAPSTKRAVCSRCARPQRACYCAALPPTTLLTHRTRVVVLQHTKEQRQRHAISSVPVLVHVLTSPNSVDVVPVSSDAQVVATLHDALDRVVLAEAADAVFVLFPHADAKTLSAALVPPQRPAITDLQADNGETKSVVLVVIDGTWTEAKKIVHHSRSYWDTIAQECRERNKVFEYVCLESDDETSRTTSIYGELRKEPMGGCVSTLEAVAMALRVLEPEPEATTVCGGLLHAFQAMVSIQTAFLQRGRAEQQAKHGGTPKPKPSRRPRDEPSLPAVDADQEAGPETRGVVKPYVFYTTHTDFRKRQRLVVEGDILVCTRDQAIAHCNALNRDRTRGNRMSTLPEDVFEQQRQLAQDNDDESRRS